MAIGLLCTPAAIGSSARSFIDADGFSSAVSWVYAASAVLIGAIVAAIESASFSHSFHVPTSCVTL
ncbi:MAG: hypothetical protein ACTTH7_03625 [Treponema sp.]